MTVPALKFAAVGKYWVFNEIELGVNVPGALVNGALQLKLLKLPVMVPVNGIGAFRQTEVVVEVI
jgi:hypothetical protein